MLNTYLEPQDLGSKKMSDLTVGHNQEFELRLRLQEERARSEQRHTQENPAINSKDINKGYFNPLNFGPNIPKSAEQIAFNTRVDSKKNLITENRDSAWNQLGAINTQNTSADSDSIKLGRDNLKAQDHMLEAQLDNQNNSFAKFSHAGKDYIAFRSNNVAYGNYFGFKELNGKNWQELKKAPIDPEKLKQNIDKVHEQKQELINRVGGFENYKIVQKLEGEFKDFQNPTLNSNHREAFERIKGISNDLEKIKSGKTTTTISELQANYEAIKKDHPQLVAELLNNRIDKVNLSTEEISSIKNQISRINFNNKDEAHKTLLDLEKDINSKVNDKLNTGQHLNQAEQAEYTKHYNEVQNLMTKLAHSTDGKSSEFQKLEKYFNSENFDTDTNKSNQGKYSLEQLKAFRNHLEVNNWFTRAEALDKKTRVETQEKVFQNKEELTEYLKAMPNGERILAKSSMNGNQGYYTKDSQGNIYRDEGNLLANKIEPNNQFPFPVKSNDSFVIQKDNENFKAYKVEVKLANYPVLLTNDESTNLKKVFALSENQSKYQEILTSNLDKANIDVYKIIKNSQENYFMLNPEKNSFWEVKLPKSTEGFLTASKYDLTMMTTKYHASSNGMNFNFDLNGNLIGIDAMQSRSEGLFYTNEEIQAARKKAFEI